MWIEIGAIDRYRDEWEWSYLPIPTIFILNITLYKKKKLYAQPMIDVIRYISYIIIIKYR